MSRQGASTESLLLRVDGRIKTPFFLLTIIATCLLAHWYLVAILWLFGLALLLGMRLPWRKTLIRLLSPFAIAWFVVVTVMFTSGGHPVWSLSLGGYRIFVYREGLMRGILILFRIMAAVTLAELLSLSTPMSEVLESLRLFKVPDLLVDLAAMMYRYIDIIEERSRNLHRAQQSRMGDDAPWRRRISDLGKLAGMVLVGSIDRSTRIYQAMLSRGYDEDSKNIAFFTASVPRRDWCIGIVGMAAVIVLVCLDFFIPRGSTAWN